MISRAIADKLANGRPRYSKPVWRTVTLCSTPFHTRSNRVPAKGRSFIRLRGDDPLTAVWA
jgi:hypothetical protein